MPIFLRRSVIAIAMAGLFLLGSEGPVLAQDGPPGPSATSDGSEPSQGGGSQSFFRWMAEASGPIGLVILAMSFYLIALIAWMAMEYRRSVAVPDRLIREISDLLASKEYTEAYNRLSESPSFLGKVLAAGVRKLPSGQAPALRAMELANDDATMAMEHRTTYLATVGTLGPMIGLVGTVYGMILSFRVIATAGGSPQASQLAAGISTALFATLEGIALSIPAIFFHAMYRNRIARLSLEVMLAAESLLEQFSPGIRTPHPLVASAVNPPPRGNPSGPASS
ncbi:MotA/TolQ/ExbB proton channel family protein [Tundrisphaera lichenicola]|uniref:MotA/TolQ/ExbB proton channel family protein n=1 Tax=Tundrisphaera lichenicola TaxID=2029860 RepID=UPI003EBFA7C9